MIFAYTTLVIYRRQNCGVRLAKKGEKGGMMQHLQPLLSGIIRQVALALQGKARLMHLKGVLEVPGNRLVKAGISRVV